MYYDIGTGDVLSNETRLSLTDTIQVGSALGGDTYSLTYTIEDSAGNVSDTSPALSLVVDVSRPSVPNDADLIDASDGGQSSTDNFTNLAQQTIDPACESLTEEGLHGCTAAYLNVAGGVGDAAVGYITKNVADSVERTASLDHISRLCDTAITNISIPRFAIILNTHKLALQPPACAWS